jgi:uncharacterized protein (TIGR00251 family)
MKLLEIKVRAGAKKNAVDLQEDGSFKISTTATPEKGKANKAVLTLLANYLGKSKSDLEIASGQTSSNKRIRVK